MSDELVHRYGREPRSLSEELFGREAYIKIFVSSKMRHNAFLVERAECAAAIEATGIARAWYWERDANAGPYCSESVCLGQASHSDGLILIIGDELTPITRKEFAVVSARGVPAFVLADQRETQPLEVEQFIEEVRSHDSVTKAFANLAELESHVTAALRTFISRSWRRASFLDWEAGQAGAP